MTKPNKGVWGILVNWLTWHGGLVCCSDLQGAVLERLLHRMLSQHERRERYRDLIGEGAFHDAVCEQNMLAVAGSRLMLACRRATPRWMARVH